MKTDSRTNKKTRKPRAHTGTRVPHYESALKNLRDIKGMTLAELEDATGISANVLSRIESGRTALVETFETLADYFGVPLDAFVRNDLKAVLAALPQDPANPDPTGVIDIMQKNSKTTGKKGERFVLGLERASLAGTPYAKGVTDSPAHCSCAHFDILSFTLDGNPRSIEVKSTKYEWDLDFIMTAEELRFMEDCVKNGKAYELHRVYGLKTPATADRIIYSPEEILSKFTITPASYRLSLKEEYR